MEPYRDRVIEALRQGGNHRTIHLLLQAQGFAGSANAVYQYILKLREEMPEAIRPVPCEPPSDLRLDQISRHEVHRQVLKHAADNRRQAMESPSDPEPVPVAPKTRFRAPSPYSDQARALMYGEDPAAEATTPTDPDSDTA